MDADKKKMSSAKLIALIISVGLHAIVFFYLGRMALDYALPKGEVSSLEMNFDSSKGEQTHTTDVDVVETKPAPPVPPPPKAPEPPKPEPVKPAPVAKKSAPVKSAPPKDLPTKEVKETVEDKQGTMPVATEIPEDTQKELMEDLPPKTEPKLETETAPDNPPEVAPVAAPTPAPQESATQAQAESQAPQAAQAATDQAYGTPLGNSTETLVPFGTNRSHTYPYLARFRKYEGVAVVHYTVSANGDVTDAQVVTSSGHSVLDDEAVDTIKKWKFKPMKNEVVYEKYVRFQLKGDAKEAPSLLRRSKQQ